MRRCFPEMAERMARSGFRGGSSFYVKIIFAPIGDSKEKL
jgi:hypothetical protein